MKEFKHYGYSCEDCEKEKTCKSQTGIIFGCCTSEFNPKSKFIAENRVARHYFDNEESFNRFLRANFGEYRAILPKNYYEQKFKGEI